MSEKQIKTMKRKIKELQDERGTLYVQKSVLLADVSRKNALLRDLLKWLAENSSPNRLYGIEKISKEVLP